MTTQPSISHQKSHENVPDLIRPAAPAAAQYPLPVPFTIREITQDNYRTRTFVLDGELDAVPGQFVMAWLPRFDEKPFSLVSAAPLTLMITAVGPFTRLVHTLAVGDSLWLRGPFGRGFTPHVGLPSADPEARKRRVALVAGGYGVAPLYWFAQTWLAETNRARERASLRPALTVILGARGQADLLYRERFARLFAHSPIADSPIAQPQIADPRVADPGHRLVLTTDDGSHGLQGRVTDALAPSLAAGEIGAVLACGPDPMLMAVDALCREFGVPGQLSWEAYMRCGVGLCGSCEHGGRLLCMDGPVLGI
ncbi:MAG: hypothetical protein WDZ49_00625 [Litorilinea sp.]